MICGPIGPGVHIIAGSVCWSLSAVARVTRVTCLINASVKSDAQHMISDCRSVPCKTVVAEKLDFGVR